MAVTATNLIMGPGALYKGAFGATEPLDTAINAAPPASAFTDLGGTNDGVSLAVDQEFADLTVDQVVDTIGRRLTKREMSFGTNLAEPTLENFSLALNGGTIATGANFKSYEPVSSIAATQANYFSSILDGFAPGATVLTRRVIARKCLNIETVEASYTKDGMTLIPVKFASHWVSASIAPFKIIDQTS